MQRKKETETGKASHMKVSSREGNFNTSEMWDQTPPASYFTLLRACYDNTTNPYVMRERVKEIGLVIF